MCAPSAAGAPEDDHEQQHDQRRAEDEQDVVVGQVHVDTLVLRGLIDDGRDGRILLGGIRRLDQGKPGRLGDVSGGSAADGQPARRGARRSDREHGQGDRRDEQSETLHGSSSREKP
jgi:hypothetical protein